MNEQDVNWWLDVQKLGTYQLDKVCRKENQAEFLKIVAKREDYTYNGLSITKSKVKQPLEVVEDYFRTFEYPEKITTPYGHFVKYRLKTFVNNQIQCAKNHKISQYRKDSVTALTKLVGFLSTQKAS